MRVKILAVEFSAAPLRAAIMAATVSLTMAGVAVAAALAVLGCPIAVAFARLATGTVAGITEISLRLALWSAAVVTRAVEAVRRPHRELGLLALGHVAFGPRQGCTNQRTMHVPLIVAGNGLRCCIGHVGVGKQRHVSGIEQLR